MIEIKNEHKINRILLVPALINVGQEVEQAEVLVCIFIAPIETKSATVEPGDRIAPFFLQMY